MKSQIPNFSQEGLGPARGLPRPRDGDAVHADLSIRVLLFHFILPYFLSLIYNFIFCLSLGPLFLLGLPILFSISYSIPFSFSSRAPHIRPETASRPPAAARPPAGARIRTCAATAALCLLTLNHHSRSKIHRFSCSQQLFLTARLHSIRISAGAEPKLTDERARAKAIKAKQSRVDIAAGSINPNDAVTMLGDRFKIQNERLNALEDSQEKLGQAPFPNR